MPLSKLKLKVKPEFKAEVKISFQSDNISDPYNDHQHEPHIRYREYSVPPSVIRQLGTIKYAIHRISQGLGCKSVFVGKRVL